MGASSHGSNRSNQPARLQLNASCLLTAAAVKSSCKPSNVWQVLPMVRRCPCTVGTFVGAIPSSLERPTYSSITSPGVGMCSATVLHLMHLLMHWCVFRCNGGICPFNVLWT